MCNKSSIKTIIGYMDYGRPMKPFFIEILNFWAWSGKLGKKIGGIWGTFSQFISPLSMFSIIQPTFLKKLSLFIHIPNFYLRLGLEFRPKRIRDVAFVWPKLPKLQCCHIPKLNFLIRLN